MAELSEKIRLAHEVQDEINRQYTTLVQYFKVRYFKVITISMTKWLILYKSFPTTLETGKVSRTK